VRLHPERAMRIAKSAAIILSFILITIIFAEVHRNFFCKPNPR